MVIPSPKSNKTISLNNKGLIYQHKWSFSKASIKRNPRMINNIKASNHYLSVGCNINIGLHGMAIRAIENQCEGFLFLEHSPINIEESNKTNFLEIAAKCEKVVKNNEKVYVFHDEMDYETRDTQTGKYQVDISGNNCNNMDDISNKHNYKSYPTRSYNENPNVGEGYSGFNWNDCSQIDSQSYSKEHQNTNHYYYPNNQCENCQNLKLQNDNAQSEIRKLRSDFEKLKEQNKLEREKFIGEIEYLKSNNASLQSKYNYLNDSRKLNLNNYNKKISENEKFKLENAIANRKYNEMNQLNENLQIENENLKSQLIKYESRTKKFGSEIIKFGSERRKFDSESRKFGSESRKFGSKSKKFGSESRKFGSKIRKYKSIIQKYRSENEKLEKLINNLESENKLLNQFNIEHEKYRSENEKCRSENEKYRSENEKCRSENEKYRSENEKYRSENEKYRSENKLLNKFKMENENLKSQIIKSVSKIRKSQSKSKRMKKGKIPNLGKTFQSLNSQSVKSSSENFNWNKDLPIGNDNSTIHDDDKLERNTLPLNISSNNKLPNDFGKELVSCSELLVIKTETWKPLGFANPKGYCYLNSVVQVLGSCEDFKMDIYKCESVSSENTNDSIFVEGLFNLIRAIRECNRANLDKSLNIVQQNITESSFGDDVYKCFMNLLTRVSNVVKTNIDRPADHFTKLPINLSEKAKVNFERFKNRNPGFVFDNFYGQLTFQTVCKLCNFVCNESFQLMKSLPLPVPTSNFSVTLNSCIDLFFKDSEVELDEPMKCKCSSGPTKSLKSITKLTHGPKYLFVYLNRGSYTDDGDKNNTEVTCDDVNIDLKTLEDKSIKYNLISVIDHIGDSAGGHYYCKCSFESDKWWLLNDSQSDLLQNKNEIVTKNTIVFLLKKTS